MSEGRDFSAPEVRSLRLPWRLLSLAIIASGVLLVAAANVHLVYVAVRSQPECALRANLGESETLRAASPAC